MSLRNRGSVIASLVELVLKPQQVGLQIPSVACLGHAVDSSCFIFQRMECPAQEVDFQLAHQIGEGLLGLTLGRDVQPQKGQRHPGFGTMSGGCDLSDALELRVPSLHGRYPFPFCVTGCDEEFSLLRTHLTSLLTGDVSLLCGD